MRRVHVQMGRVEGGGGGGGREREGWPWKVTSRTRDCTWDKEESGECIF